MYLSSDYRRLVGLVCHPPADTLASTWSICLAIFVIKVNTGYQDTIHNIWISPDIDINTFTAVPLLLRLAARAEWRGGADGGGGAAGGGGGSHAGGHQLQHAPGDMTRATFRVREEFTITENASNATHGRWGR